MSLKLNASIQVFEAGDLWDFHVNQGNGRGKVQFTPWKKPLN